MPSLNIPLTHDERKAAITLKRAIIASGKTQFFISQTLGCSQGTISQWANAFCRVPAKWAIPLGELLNIPPEDISPSYKRIMDAALELQPESITPPAKTAAKCVVKTQSQHMHSAFSALQVL